MNRIAVTSTSVASIGYDASTMTLEVEFQHGAVYQYLDVSSSVYHEMMNAASIGVFLNQNVRNVYRCIRI